MGSLATVNDSLFKWVKNKLKRIDVIKDSKLYLISLKIILNAKKKTFSDFNNAYLIF